MNQREHDCIISVDYIIKNRAVRSFNTNMEEASDLRAALLRFLEATEMLDAIPEDMRDILKLSLCRATLRVVPEVQTKINEIVRGDEENMTVSKAPQGHDLADGEKLYEKTSRVTRLQKKCNFNWRIPRADTVEERRARLLDSVEEKTHGGGAVFTITDSMAKVVRKYRLSSEFLLEYFNHTPLTLSREKYTFGSTFCWKCKECPRLKRIADADADFRDDPEQVDWVKLFRQGTRHVC